MKDRFDAFRRLLKPLSALPLEQLERIASSALHSGPSRLGPLSDAISAAAASLPRHREPNASCVRLPREVNLVPTGEPRAGRGPMSPRNSSLRRPLVSKSKLAGEPAAAKVYCNEYRSIFHEVADANAAPDQASAMRTNQYLIRHLHRHQSLNDCSDNALFCLASRLIVCSFEGDIEAASLRTQRWISNK